MNKYLIVFDYISTHSSINSTAIGVQAIESEDLATAQSYADDILKRANLENVTAYVLPLEIGKYIKL